MRLEIPDGPVPGDLVKHYAEIKRRLRGVKEAAPKPLPPEPEPDMTAQEAAEEIERLTNEVVAIPSRPVFDQFRAIAVRCGLREPTMGLVVFVVREFYGLSHTELMSHRRARSYCQPRQIGMYLCRELTTRSLPDIGRFFNKRDHTTVLHGCRRIEALCNSDEHLAYEVGVLKQRISEAMR